jgi:hypothetical protein
MKWFERIPLLIVGIVVAMMLAAAVFGQDNRVDAIVITGLDVSSSINAKETALQITGTAEALKSPVVLAAIQNGKLGRIGVLVFLWADGTYPEVLSWRIIASEKDAEAASAEVAGKLEQMVAAADRSIGTLTNLSGALDNALALLNTSPFESDRRLVNIVGNGEDNVGEAPLRSRDNLITVGATINGVIVGGDKAVVTYYRDNVIGGKHAFTRIAETPQDVVGAMISKFVSEIAMVQ